MTLVVRDVDPFGIEERTARAELRQHPTPIRIAAVQRALHELTIGNGPSRELRIGVGACTDDPDRDVLGRAFGVVLHHLREPAAHLGHRVREPMWIDLAGAPVGEHEHGVVRGAAAVDAEAVEGLRDGIGKRALQHRGLHERIGREDREHGGHRRRQHRRALRHPADGKAGSGHGLLAHRVGRHDRPRGVGAAVGT